MARSTAPSISRTGAFRLTGEQVQFQLNNETSAGLEYSLTGPNGFVGFTNLTGSSSLVNLTQTGTYTLSAQGVNGATGNYSFNMIPSTLTNVPLDGSVNETLAGSGRPNCSRSTCPPPKR